MNGTTSYANLGPNNSGVFQSGSASLPTPPPPPTTQGFSRPLQPLSPSSLRAFSVSGRRLKSLKQQSAVTPTPLQPTLSHHHHHQRHHLDSRSEHQRDSKQHGGLHEPLQQQRISLSSAGTRASSRLSMNGPMHWGESEEEDMKNGAVYASEAIVPFRRANVQPGGYEAQKLRAFLRRRWRTKMQQCRA